MCVFVLVVCIATVGGVGLPLATSLGRRSPARYTDALGASCLGLRLLAVGVGCVCVLATSSIGLVAPQGRHGAQSAFLMPVLSKPSRCSLARSTPDTAIKMFDILLFLANI